MKNFNREDESNWELIEQEPLINTNAILCTEAMDVGGGCLVRIVNRLEGILIDVLHVSYLPEIGIMEDENGFYLDYVKSLPFSDSSNFINYNKPTFDDFTQEEIEFIMKNWFGEEKEEE